MLGEILTSKQSEEDSLRTAGLELWLTLDVLYSSIETLVMTLTMSDRQGSVGYKQ